MTPSRSCRLRRAVINRNLNGGFRGYEDLRQAIRHSMLLAYRKACRLRAVALTVTTRSCAMAISEAATLEPRRLRSRFEQTL